MQFHFLGNIKNKRIDRVIRHLSFMHEDHLLAILFVCIEITSDPLPFGQSKHNEMALFERINEIAFNSDYLTFVGIFVVAQ